MSNSQQKVLNYEGLQYFYNGLAEQFAPIDHASAAKTFGVGSTTNYGHLKVGSNISVSSGTISLSKANVTSALGYTPPTTDTNTHYITKIYAGASGTTTNAATSNPYLKVVDDSTYRNQIQFKGSGATTVSSNANGVITISSTDNNTTYGLMGAATSFTAGSSGLVPAPTAGKQISFLRGDGTWAVPTDTKVVKVYKDDSSGYIKLISDNSSTTNYTLTLPSNNGILMSSTGGTFTGEVKFSNSGVWPCWNFIRKDTINSTSTITARAQDFIAGSASSLPYRGFRIYSSSKADGINYTPISYYEDYRLPTATANRTSNGTYYILTSKSVVTIAQGGTGATSASSALINLGIIASAAEPSSPTTGMIWLKLSS